MERFFVFIIRNDVWILILCAMGLFWYATELIRAQRLLRRAMFGLERETGTRKRNNALLFIGLFAAIIGLVFYVNTQVAPNLPEEVLNPVPVSTPDIFLTPLSSPTPLGGPVEQRPSPTPPLAPTVTLPGVNAPSDDTLAATPTLEAPPTPFIACNQDLNITQPRDGGAANGEVSFFGTADTSDFSFYSMEINGPQTQGQWASLLGRDVDTPVRDGFLGESNLGAWENGPYLVRLTAVDTAGNVTGQCAISITLANPQ